MAAMTNRRAATDDTKALGAILAAKRQIDHMMARIQTLGDDHFDTDPDAIHWGDIGTLNHYSSLLRQITDSAFSEGHSPSDTETPISCQTLLHELAWEKSVRG